MSNRQNLGQETSKRLLDWESQSIASQRLANGLLTQEGYSINPSNLQGPDGSKDAIARKDEKIFIVAVYFCAGQKDFTEIFKKFKSDFTGVSKNQAIGIIFFTNQHIGESDKQKLATYCSCYELILYHKERISTLLDTPINYGRRLEFLSIEMTKEEQLAFYAAMVEEQSDRFEKLNNNINNILDEMKHTAQLVADYSTGGMSYCYVVIHRGENESDWLQAKIYTAGDNNIPFADINVYKENEIVSNIKISNINSGAYHNMELNKLKDFKLENQQEEFTIEILASNFYSKYNLNMKKLPNGSYCTHPEFSIKIEFKGFHKGKDLTLSLTQTIKENSPTDTIAT